MDPNTITPTPPEQEYVTEEGEEAIPQSSFPKKKIISLAIGVVVVLIIIFFVFTMFLTPQPTPGNATLKYWGLWDDPPIYSQVIKDFEKENPTIKVEYEKIDIRVHPYISFIRRRIKEGTGPDVYRYHNSWTDQLKDTYLLALPGDIVKKHDFKNQYPDVVEKDLMRNGAYYGTVQGIDTLAMLVNDEMLTNAGTKVPVNWFEFDDAVRDVTVTEQETGKVLTAGAAMGTFENVAHASDIISLLFAQSGIEIQDLIGSDQEAAAAARRRVIKAIEYYTCFARNADYCEKVWDGDMDNSKLAFVKENVGIIFGYSWDVFEIEGIKKQLNPDFEYSIHPVPVLESPDGTKRNQTIASYWADGVSSNSRASDAAFKFLEFLSRKDIQTKIYNEQVKQRTMGVPYARLDLAKTIYNNPLLGTFSKQAPVAHSTPFSSDTYDGIYNSRLNKYLNDTVNLIVFDNSSVESAVDEKLIPGLREIYAKTGN